MPVRASAPAFALALLVAPAAAHAQMAPLPPHWSTDAAEVQAPASLGGIAGHGFAEVTAIPAAPEICQGSPAEQAALTALAQHRTEFWFYATPREGVLFRRTLSIDPAMSCAAAARWQHDVTRATVARGEVRSFRAGPGDPVPISARPIGISDGARAGEALDIHDLMARTPPPYGAGSTATRVAGTAARCKVWGGLAWGRICLGASGPLRGMLLAAELGGDDQGEMAYLAFDRLDPAARLDPRLFEPARNWRSGD